MAFRRNVLFLVLLGVAATCPASPIRASADTVIVNEIPVMRFRTSQDGVPPSGRASIVAKRISNSNGSMRYESKKRQAKLYRGDTLITVINSTEARAQDSTPGSLAATWASKVRNALNLPALRISDNQFRLPPGASRSLRLVGSGAWEATVQSSDPSIVSANRTSEGIDFQTGKPGHATLQVSGGGAVEQISVDVWPYAANFPQTLSATVSGFPAQPETVRGAIEGAVRNQFQTVDQGKWTFTLKQAGEVAAGETQTFNVQVSATAPNSFPRAGTVQVQVRNTPAAKRGEDELWYCNDPENVKQPGPLFSATLKSDKAARLLYHHVNMASQGMFLRIQLVNNSPLPAHVVLIPGDSKPDKDPVLAGLMAGDQYMSQWMTSSGEVVTVPPGSSLPVSLRRMTPGDTVSGLCSLRLLPDGPGSVFVRADAVLPFPTDDKWEAALASPSPWRVVGTLKISPYDTAPSSFSTHIYPNPYKEEAVNYSVGGRYGFVRIGQRPISNHDQSTALDGNFGVVYTIRASVDNPTTTPMNLELVFEASAGYAGGLFVVNGVYSKTHPMPPKGEKQLTRFRLEPGESKKFTILTVPLSGSSYPATLTIRPIQDSSMFSGSGRKE